MSADLQSKIAVKRPPRVYRDPKGKFYIYKNKKKSLLKLPKSIQDLKSAQIYTNKKLKADNIKVNDQGVGYDQILPRPNWRNPLLNVLIKRKKSEQAAIKKQLAYIKAYEKKMLEEKKLAEQKIKEEKEQKQKQEVIDAKVRRYREKTESEQKQLEIEKKKLKILEKKSEREEKLLRDNLRNRKPPQMRSSQASALNELKRIAKTDDIKINPSDYEIPQGDFKRGIERIGDLSNDEDYKRALKQQQSDSEQEKMNDDIKRRFDEQKLRNPQPKREKKKIDPKDLVANTDTEEELQRRLDFENESNKRFKKEFTDRQRKLNLEQIRRDRENEKKIGPLDEPDNSGNLNSNSDNEEVPQLLADIDERGKASPDFYKKIAIDPLEQKLNQDSDNEENIQKGTGPNRLPALYSDEIEDFFKDEPKFLGVIAKDQIEELPKQYGGFIMNLDTSLEPGSHWVAINITPTEVEYFDPLADKPDKETIIDIKKHIKDLNSEHLMKFKINQVKQQHANSFRCGYHCLRFLDDRFAGLPFPLTTRYSTRYNNIVDDSKNGESIIKEQFQYI